MSIAEIRKKLDETIAAKNDPSYARTHSFNSGEAVGESEIAAREREIGVRFPPSYREALVRYGCFTLGTLGGELDHLVCQIWPLEQHRTALAEYASQLECDETAAAVAEEIGLEERVVAALGKVVLFGVDGQEDYLGFDVRTQHSESGECQCRLVLFDDTEIEALAEATVEVYFGRGFDDWLERHIQRRG